ncbi:MAG: MurR/RpiR family transcriptional regulator [Thermovirgaceae bacterium]|nr:MurR/RpiR family transcriptional regulator [Thermovirgaceae bacterium]
METGQLQELLREKMQGMPNKAHRVVEYLLNNMREAAFRSIGDVAADLGVSKAQLVRVSRMLGFEGYSQLKDALQSAMLSQVNPAAMLARVLNNRQDLPTTIHRLEHANLDDTWSQILPGNVSSFCSMLQEAESVYCIGWGISSMVAESFFIRLRTMGMRAILMTRSGMTLQEQARSIRKNDIVVVCELPSFVIEVTEAVEIAKKNGARIITITDSPAAPICRHSDLPFFVSAASPMFGSSIIGPLFLVHILTSVLAVNMGDATRTAMEEQARFLHDERIFHPIFGLKYS